MRKKELTDRIELRVSVFEKNRINWLAKKYAGGNVSLYIIYHAMNGNRLDVNPEHIKEYSERRNKKDQN